MENISPYSKVVLRLNGNTCTIINGDCRDVLQDYIGSFDLIITSPPYADARKHHYDSQTPDGYKEWFSTFHEPFYRSLKPNGSFVLNIKDKVVNGVRHRYVWETILALSNLGWLSIDDYIWHKPNPMPGYWPNRLMDGWEYCFHLAKSIKPYFNREAVRKPVGEWALSRLRNLNQADLLRHNSANESGFGRDISKWVGKNFVSPSNVLSVALVGKNKGHPAVFPIDIPLFFIKLLCPPGGTVLDPFSGSGTTGIAALLLGMNCVLIDNNLGYYQESIDRINRELKVRNGKQSLTNDENIEPIPRQGELGI